MFHHVAHAVHRRLLFHNWDEGRHLYHQLCHHARGARAIFVMPNHVHVLAPDEALAPIGRALRAHARMLNYGQGRGGQLFVRRTRPSQVSGSQKIARNERYIWLNGCRAGLTSDPLQWPLSNYRDALGLGWRPQRRASADPRRLHSYVSSDPSVTPEGSVFPTPSPIAPTLEAVRQAVCFLARCSPTQLCLRGPARRLYLSAARALCNAPAHSITASVGLRRRALFDVSPLADEVALVARLCGDRRFLQPPAHLARGAA